MFDIYFSLLLRDLVNFTGKTEIICKYEPLSSRVIPSEENIYILKYFTLGNLSTSLSQYFNIIELDVMVSATYIMSLP